MNEAQFQESCKLRNQLRKMQYDESLTVKQRKMANELFKEICGHPQFPSIHPDVIRKMINKIVGAQQQGPYCYSEQEIGWAKKQVKGVKRY